MTCDIACICARATRTYTSFVWNAGAARAAYHSLCSLKFAPRAHAAHEPNCTENAVADDDQK